jgi:hypothetical protein
VRSLKRAPLRSVPKTLTTSPASPDVGDAAAQILPSRDINMRVDSAVGRLDRTVGNLDPAVRQTIRDAMAKELVGLSDQVTKTTAALAALRKSADWAQLLVGAGLALLVVVITLGGFWLFTPSVAEMSWLRKEQEQLQASIDLLASHGGRADLRKCGDGNAHLCVRVEPGLGRFREAKDHFCESRLLTR